MKLKSPRFLENASIQFEDNLVFNNSIIFLTGNLLDFVQLYLGMDPKDPKKF